MMFVNDAISLELRARVQSVFRNFWVGQSPRLMGFKNDISENPQKEQSFLINFIQALMKKSNFVSSATNNYIKSKMVEFLVDEKVRADVVELMQFEYECMDKTFEADDHEDYLLKT